jgi:hypothetical protein
MGSKLIRLLNGAEDFESNKYDLLILRKCLKNKLALAFVAFNQAVCFAQVIGENAFVLIALAYL